MTVTQICGDLTEGMGVIVRVFEGDPAHLKMIGEYTRTCGARGAAELRQREFWGRVAVRCSERDHDGWEYYRFETTAGYTSTAIAFHWSGDAA